jgi:hypothetical protein
VGLSLEKEVPIKEYLRSIEEARKDYNKVK